MKAKHLIDTHILLWWLGSGNRLSKRIKQILNQTTPETPLLLSDISLWEIAMLSALGRITLSGSLRDWSEAATAPPLVLRQPITPAIAAEVASLPSDFPRDPADRIIVATARVLGLPLITYDQRIINAKLVDTIF